jgi:hypothetical protein
VSGLVIEATRNTVRGITGNPESRLATPNPCDRISPSRDTATAAPGTPKVSSALTMTGLYLNFDIRHALHFEERIEVHSR